MKKTTLKDVADAAGISIAAVSMILSGKGKISPALVEKVTALATEMGYIRRLQQARTRNSQQFEYVAVLQQETVPFLWNFSVPFALALEDQILHKGKIPLIFHIPTLYTPKMLFKEIVGAQVGAVFSMHYIDRGLFNDLESIGIPVIIVNNSEYRDAYWTVISDNHQGSYDATMHLIGMGHTRIAYAEYKRPDYPLLMADRLFGYRRALEEWGLLHPQSLVASVKIDDYPSLVDRVRSIQAGPEAPTAWVAHDDFFAAYLITALQSLGVQVPSDVSVIAAGGDVLDYTQPFIPRITTFKSDKQLMAAMAWNLLESRLEARSSDIQVVKTKMTLIDRGSCIPV